MTLHIYQNTQKFAAQKMNLIICKNFKGTQGIGEFWNGRKNARNMRK